MKSIIIKSIELKNYRQYLKQKIEFEYSEEKNLCVIQGRNGYGKSNIFNAINWCFFGLEEHLQSDSSKKEPLCNTKALNDLKKGGHIDTKVSILIQTPEGEKILEREKRFKKDSSGNIIEGRPDFVITECFGRDWKISPYPEYVVSRILPRQMRNFFYIDGEKLRVLFENLKPEDVKGSIFDLSQINMLQNAINHLSTYKAKLRQQVRDVPDLEKLEEAMERANKEIEGFEEEYSKLNKQLEDAKIVKNKIVSQIEELGDQNVNDMEFRRKQLDESIASLQGVFERIEAEYLNYLYDVAPIIICHGAIQESLKQIASAQEKGIYPPPHPRAVVIDFILKGKHCFCTAKLDDQRRKALEEIKSHAHAEDILKDVDKLQTLLGQYLTEYDTFEVKVEKYNQNLSSLQGRIELEQKELKGVTTKLGNTDIEKVNYLSKERAKYETQINNAQREIFRLQALIETQRTLVKQIDKKYNQQLAKIEKYKSVNDKVKLSQKGIEIITSIKEGVMSEIKKETTKYTKKFFNNLVSAKDFDKIDIREDYQLIVERDGYNCLYSLSAAETLCLGYSFMSALRKSSGFLAPIVIDTPLAKVDSQYRANIANWIINSLGNAQVILLVTDTEYTKGFRDEIYSIISQEFRINHNKNKRISEVVIDE